jgi:hypothetical protein
VPAELVETAMRLELEDGAVVADDLEGRRCLFLAALYRAEREIAEKLRTLAVGKPPWPRTGLAGDAHGGARVHRSVSLFGPWLLTRKYIFSEAKV